ncbi:GNAT family N-acetyltransferase [Thalassotalea insulae]|nr:GNAT family N-acetyltransferase [Thalassotalea insulae]
MINQHSLQAPIAFAKLITCNNIIAGFVIHSWKFATFFGTRELFMQAIYIKSEFRRQGIAAKALGQLAQFTLTSGCSRMEWYVMDDNSTGIKFYDT